MFKSVVYQGNNLLGEVEVYPLDHKSYILSKEIRISHYSKQSERCSPLSILHTIAPNGLSFKMESKSLSSSLGSLHSTCLSESKTAVMQLGEEEFHLVAMSSRTDSELYSYFWCFIVSKGLYDSCLTMLNLRCLGIVFDLDETLVVANTMRSFEDRIEALQRKISTENPQRVDSILAEIKRYHEDKAILKQYLDNDQVVDNGMVFKTQSEVVLALSENIPQTARPIVRLPEKNIILTRINPANRDTSVLVRLRPAWEDLRNYLTARGRKRFEVYVCTMAEKDYALEMWRLLDPGLNLINSKELLDRIVCVKAGSRKSLLSVFHDGICHPKMALVIDDRLKVWDEKDQSRVHVVPPFVPYYAPQAEVNNTVPVLCVARNVACNVRGNFFKEFDEGLLQSLSDVFYEDNVPDITAPDVGNYLISEDDASGSNKDLLRLEGISDIEVERRLKEANPSPAVVVTDLESRLAPLQFAVSTSSNTISQPQSEGPSMPFHSIQLPQTASVVKLLPSTGLPQSSSQGSPGREEGELPESDVDPDTRRRILILQHGQDRRDNMPMDTPFPVTPPVQASPPPVQSHRGWPPLEEDVSMRQPNQSVPKPVPRKFPTESETIQFDKQRPSLGSYFQGMEGSVSSDRSHFNNRKFKEARRVDHHPRLKHPFSSYRSMPGNKPSLGPLAKSIKDSYVENGSDNSFYPAETPFDVLQRIAKECQTKVELKPALSNSTELQFTVEVWFAGEKIGEGNGRTRKEAQHLAGECAISTLADKYLSSEKLNNLSQQNESDVMRDSMSFGRGQSLKEEHPYSTLTTTSAAPSGRYLDARMMENGSKKPLDSVSALKQLCFKEGLALMFIKGQQTTISNPLQREEEQALVEIGGKLLGRGTGSTMEEAKIEAAEEALDNLKSIYATQKSASSPKPLPFFANKRMKPDSACIVDQYSSLSRYW